MHTVFEDLFVAGVPLLEKVVRTVGIYLFLLVGLRLAGKRELGQLNPFDLVVLLLLSNTVQNAIIGDDTSLLGGMVGGATLLVVNYLVVRFLYRHKKLDLLIEGRADTLIQNGRILQKRLEREMITVAELEAAARRQGIAHLSDVETARLEVGGAMTFVPRTPSEEDRRHREVMDRLAALEARLAAVTRG